MFRVKFRTGGAAFEDEYVVKESARILREIADKLEKGYDYGACMDINGNKVGEWSLEV